MERNILLSKIVDKKKGVYRKITWSKPADVYKEYKDLNIVKETTTVCRLGIQYGHIASIQQYDINGNVIEQDPRKLPWGEWDSECDCLINHKGNTYLRITKSLSPKHHTTVKWYMDGKQVEKETIAKYLKASANASNDDTVVFNINVANILTLQ